MNRIEHPSNKGKMLYESLKDLARIHEFKFREESWEELDENTKQYFRNSAWNFTTKLWDRIREN